MKFKIVIFLVAVLNTSMTFAALECGRTAVVMLISNLVSESGSQLKIADQILNELDKIDKSHLEVREIVTADEVRRTSLGLSPELAALGNGTQLDVVSPTTSKKISIRWKDGGYHIMSISYDTPRGGGFQLD